MSLLSLIDDQNRITKLINKAFQNYKKDSNDRKTSDYLHKRINDLTAHWKNFQSNHAQIIGIDEEENCVYLTDNHYKIVENTFEKYYSLLKTKMEEIQSTSKNHETQNSEEQQLLKEYKAKLQKLTSRIETLENNLAQIQSSYETLQQENEKLKNELKKYKTENLALTKENQDLKQKLMSNSQENSNSGLDLEERLKQLEYKQKAFMEKINAKSGKNRNINSDNDSDDEQEFSTKEILKMVPKFDGDSKQLKKYINTCEDLWNRVKPGLAQTKFLTVLKHNLTDEAAMLIEDEDDIQTWDEVKELLVKNFKLNYNTSIAQDVMRKTKQNKNESIQAFGDKISKLLKEIKSAVPDGAEKNWWHNFNEEIACRAFEDGIYNSEIKYRLISEHNKSLSESIRFATDTEKRLENTNLTENTVKEKTFCKYCKKNNHSIENCRLKKSNDAKEKNNSTQKCSICDKLGHSADKCFKNPKNNKKNGENKNNGKSVNKIQNKKKTKKANSEEENTEEAVEEPELEKTEKKGSTNYTIRDSKSAKKPKDAWFNNSDSDSEN